MGYVLNISWFFQRSYSIYSKMAVEVLRFGQRFGVQGQGSLAFVVQFPPNLDSLLSSNRPFLKTAFPVDSVANFGVVVHLPETVPKMGRMKIPSA